MTSQEHEVAAALAAAARSMHAPRTLEETLDTVVHTARGSLPGIDHVGISVMHRRGAIETVSATDDLVRRLDALQYELGEGPCCFAIHDAPVVVLEHAGRDQRWPRYVPRAVQLGLRSQLGLRLYTDRETLGALNMYSTTADTLDPELIHLAELFAAHAAIAMGRAREVDQLHEGMMARKVIGQAIGILMERHQITEERAFAFLSRASQTSNTKLRDIAQEIVDGAGTARRRVLEDLFPPPGVDETNPPA
jgi:GAF domain-containing protein